LDVRTVFPGINPPVPDVVHIPVVVPPETVPFNEVVELLPQTVWSAPAFTVIVGVTTIFLTEVFPTQPKEEVAVTL
jgi:hypothetical protein